MLRKVSTELTSMLESINFGKDNKGSVKKIPFGSEDHKNSMENSKIIKIEEEVNENNEKNIEISPINNIARDSQEIEKLDNVKENQTCEENHKNHNNEEEKKEEKLLEKNKKIEEVILKYKPEIEKLEKQIGQNKNSILFSKMLEKLKKEQEKALQEIEESYS